MKIAQVTPNNKERKNRLVKTVEQLTEEDKNLDFFPEHYKNTKYFEKEYLNRRKYDVIIIEQGNAAIGYIIGIKKTRHVYGVEMHYVIPDMRGFGIAKQLKRALEERARQQDFKLITSYATIDNHASIKLNENANYRQETIGHYVYFRKEL